MSSFTTTSFSKSSLFLFVMTLLVVIAVSSLPTSEAKILSTIIQLFDTPHSMLMDQQQQLQYATTTTTSVLATSKTREFLAFGDAALDYYVN
mmetsp:Transcript_40002/g.43372  ORF Transcript_40002/g.43372 Transcript_40002/m.43372 type:complete len:92 (+) Transcript_40002:128-403(+)